MRFQSAIAIRVHVLRRLRDKLDEVLRTFDSLPSLAEIGEFVRNVSPAADRLVERSLLPSHGSLYSPSHYLGRGVLESEKLTESDVTERCKSLARGSISSHRDAADTAISEHESVLGPLLPTEDSRTDESEAGTSAPVEFWETLALPRGNRNWYSELTPTDLLALLDLWDRAIYEAGCWPTQLPALYSPECEAIVDRNCFAKRCADSASGYLQSAAGQRRLDPATLRNLHSTCWQLLDRKLTHQAHEDWYYANVAGGHIPENDEPAGRPPLPVSILRDLDAPSFGEGWLDEQRQTTYRPLLQAGLDELASLRGRLEAQVRERGGRGASDPSALLGEVLAHLKGKTDQGGELHKPAQTLVGSIENRPRPVSISGDRSGVRRLLGELDSRFPGIKECFVTSGRKFHFKHDLFLELAASWQIHT